MEKFRFLNWKVYQDLKQLFQDVIQLIPKLPQEFKYELGNQIIRSSFSVILNIAEGSGKNSDKELNRHFDIAVGSVNETLAGLDVLRDNKIISETTFSKLLMQCENISRQLGGFYKHLK